MKNIFLSLTAACMLAAPAAAGGFSLNSFSPDDVRAAAANLSVPAPRAQAEKTRGGDTMEVDASIRVPFRAIQKAVAQIERLTIPDKSAPVVSRAGDFLKVSNIRIDVNGIIVEPTLMLRPYFEGRDKLALRIQRIQLHASMTPGKLQAAAVPRPTQGDMMEQIVAAVTKGIMDALNARFAARQMPLKAEDILSFRYDKAAWTLHTAISAEFVQSYLPHGLVGDIHLTGFSFNDTCIAVKFGTAD